MSHRRYHLRGRIPVGSLYISQPQNSGNDRIRTCDRYFTIRPFQSRALSLSATLPFGEGLQTAVAHCHRYIGSRPTPYYLDSTVELVGFRLDS